MKRYRIKHQFLMTALVLLFLLFTCSRGGNVRADQLRLSAYALNLNGPGDSTVLRIYGNNAYYRIADSSIATVELGQYTDGYFPLKVMADKVGSTTLTIVVSGRSQDIPLTVQGEFLTRSGHKALRIHGHRATAVQGPGRKNLALRQQRTGPEK